MTTEQFEESSEFADALCDWAANDADTLARFETTDAYRRAHQAWTDTISDTLDRLHQLRERAG